MKNLVDDLDERLLKLGYDSDYDYFSLEIWLWRNHKMYIRSGMQKDHDFYKIPVFYYAIVFFDQFGRVRIEDSDPRYDSPIEAKIAGIKECVKMVEDKITQITPNPS